MKIPKTGIPQHIECEECGYEGEITV